MSTLKVETVTKRFPGVVALDRAELEIKAGEIHALLGENGAGKSTMIKIITGVHEPTEGRVLIDDAPVRLRTPQDAMAAGIGAVHQERNLIPRFSVAENIMLEKPPVKSLARVDFQAMEESARHWLSELELDLDPQMPVKNLSVAQMQLLEIARALSLESRVLLLDEPTASISEHEVAVLFGILRRLREKGVAILFVSHKLEEVFEICDRVTVLRDGQNACTGVPIADLDRDRVIAHMVGRSDALKPIGHRAPETGAVKLELKDLSTTEGHRGISFAARKGEILGLYGLVGAGRSELARALIGSKGKITKGEMLIDGTPVRIPDVLTAMRRYRMGYVSEDRKGDGLILEHSVTDNIGVTIWHRIAKAGGFVVDLMQRHAVKPFVDRLEVKTPSLRQKVGRLSGGNQQKVSVAKWLAAGAEILIIDEPTVGVDVRTKGYLHRLIWELADTGVTVLMISSDMPEVIAVADRILVMHDRTLVADLDNSRDYDPMSAAILGAIHAVEQEAA